jgi:drug/metabolite transporter (DMT)-like permease
MQKKALNSPLLNVILFTVFWAVQIFITKVAFNFGAPVIPLIIHTGIITILLLSLYVFFTKKGGFMKASKRVMVGILIANAIHGGLGAFFSTIGIALTSAINAGFLVQFATVTTAIFAWIFLREKMTTSKALTVIFIMIGTFLLVTKGRLDPPAIGDLILIFACISWSTGNVMIRGILKKSPVDSDVVTFLRPISGLPVFIAFILFAPLYPSQVQPLFQTDFFNFNYLAFAFLNALFTAILLIFLNRTLKLASASYMTMMSSLTPLVVAILALLFLRESLTPIQYFGGFLILVSGFITHFLKIEKH